VEGLCGDGESTTSSGSASSSSSSSSGGVDKERERNGKLLKFMVSRLVTFSEHAPSFERSFPALLRLFAGVKRVLAPFRAPAGVHPDTLRDLQAAVSPSLDTVLRNCFANPSMCARSKHALLDSLLRASPEDSSSPRSRQEEDGNSVGKEEREDVWGRGGWRLLDVSMQGGVLMSVLNLVMNPAVCPVIARDGICERLSALLDLVERWVSP
jgi:hypothetical protein